MTSTGIRLHAPRRAGPSKRTWSWSVPASPASPRPCGARRRACARSSSPRRGWTTAPPAGRRAASPRPSARATPRAAPGRHPGRGSRPVRRGGGAHPRHRGPGAVRRLISTGAHFDTDDEGGIELTREGGHHRRRIAHAGGDATGAEISRALVEAVRARGVRTIENALVLDLLGDAEGRTAGVTLHVMGEGQHDGVGAVHAPAVVLATGGMGQVFSATTNPAVSTGDGVALALRAGAEVSDLEFVQFHPTVLFLGPDAEGQQPLVSEAVRGRAPTWWTPTACASCRDSTNSPNSPPGTSSPRASCGACRSGTPSTCTSTRGTSARTCGSTASRRSSPPAGPTASTRSPSPSRSPRPRTTPPAGSARTPTAAPRCPACTRAARSPARACTAPTAWPPTPSWRAWCTPSASRRTSRRAGRTAPSSRACRSRCRTRRRPNTPCCPRRPASPSSGSCRRAPACCAPRTPWRGPPTSSSSCTARPARPCTPTARRPSRASTPGRPPTSCAWPASSSRRPRSARRPAAATGARTARTATTRPGAATSSSA